jgi:hypothetical protein
MGDQKPGVKWRRQGFYPLVKAPQYARLGWDSLIVSARTARGTIALRGASPRLGVAVNEVAAAETP